MQTKPINKIDNSMATNLQLNYNLPIQMYLNIYILPDGELALKAREIAGLLNIDPKSICRSLSKHINSPLFKVAIDSGRPVTCVTILQFAEFLRKVDYPLPVSKEQIYFDLIDTQGVYLFQFNQQLLEAEQDRLDSENTI